VPAGIDRRVVLGGVVLGSMAISLDLTIVNVALPSIRADLGGDIETIQWVASLYSLAFAVFLVPAGRLVDLIGPRRTFLIGAGTYAAASLLAGAAPDDLVLILARIPQGVGAALIGPAGIALTTRLYAEDERGPVFGIVGAALGLTAGIGPLVGGLLTDTVGWRAIFLVNVPVLLSAMAVVRRAPADRDADTDRTVDLDLGGTALFGLAVLGIELALIEVNRLGVWPFGVIGICVSVLAGLALRRSDRRRDVPLIDVDLLRDRDVRACMLAKFVLGFAYSGMTLYLVLYMQGTLGLSAVQTGLVLMPAALIGVVLSPTIGRLAETDAARPLAVAGLACTAVALYVLALLDSASSVFWHLLPGLLLVGLGFAFTSIPTRVIPLDSFPESLHGRISGLSSMTGKLAGGFGVAVAALIFHQRSTPRAADAIESTDTGGLSVADIVGCLAVDDLATHVERSVKSLSDVSRSALTVVIEDTYVTVLGDIFVILGTVAAIGAVIVWRLLRRTPPA
ncbi:MAG: MFS transporter, partial [Actinomycetota bacterium]